MRSLICIKNQLRGTGNDAYQVCDGTTGQRARGSAAESDEQLDRPNAQLSIASVSQPEVGLARAVVIPSSRSAATGNFSVSEW